jgi:uncharacterized protein DUF4340
MKIRQLIAAVVVLGALAVALWWSNKHQADANSPKVAADAPIKIVSFQQDDIAKVEIKKKDGDAVVISKAGPANWKIIAPKPMLADQDPISAVLYSLSPLDADRLIEDKATDLKPYGLAEPEVVVTATGNDGNSQKVLIGDDVPTGGTAYAKLDGDPRIFTISSTSKSNLDKGLMALRDKSLMPVDFNKASKIELVSPKLNLTFAYDNGLWVVRSPSGMRGDSPKLAEVVDKLKLATLDPNTSDADAKKAAASYSSGTPVGTVKATDASGTQELQVRKNMDDYYVKSTAADGAYKVARDLGDEIDKKLDDFRSTKLFDFGENNPEKIEMQSGSKSFVLTRTADDWMENGKKVEGTTVDALLREIRLLAAMKFVTSGFSSVATELTVTSNGGKRVEKVLVSKSGDHLVAKREGEPLLYQLDGKGLDDLQKAADAIQAADAPKK